MFAALTDFDVYAVGDLMARRADFRTDMISDMYMNGNNKEEDNLSGVLRRYCAALNGTHCSFDDVKTKVTKVMLMIDFFRK